MKKQLCTLFAAISVGTAAYAAADESVQSTSKASTRPTTTTKSTAQHHALDHGPRAEVTPWVNEQRRKQANKEAQANTSTPPASPH